VFLRNIRLENIRCFVDVSINFDRAGEENRKWTVILGENGTGKSTVLKSIALLLSGSDALAEFNIDPERWIRNGSRNARISPEVSPPCSTHMPN